MHGDMMHGEMLRNAITMASIFGPFLVVMAVWMLFYKANMMKVVTSVKTTPGLLHVVGTLNLIVGLGILSQYHMWTMGWMPMLVTLFGWFLLVRGVMAFLTPHLLMDKRCMTAPYLKMKGIIFLIWGICLSWFAFWM